MLQQQIEIIQPEYILAMGELSANAILQANDPISKLRSKIHKLLNSKVVVTHHPATLLKNPKLKRETWEDVQEFQMLYR